MSAASADAYRAQPVSPTGLTAADVEAYRAYGVGAVAMNQSSRTRTDSMTSVRSRLKREDGAKRSPLGRIRKKSIFGRKTSPEPTEAAYGAKKSIQDFDQDTYTLSSTSKVREADTGDSIGMSPRPSQESFTAVQTSPLVSPSRHRKNPSLSAVSLLQAQLGMSRQVSAESSVTAVDMPSPSSSPSGRRTHGNRNAPTSWLGKLSLHGRRRRSSNALAEHCRQKALPPEPDSVQGISGNKLEEGLARPVTPTKHAYTPSISSSSHSQSFLELHSPPRKGDLAKSETTSGLDIPSRPAPVLQRAHSPVSEVPSGRSSRAHTIGGIDRPTYLGGPSTLSPSASATIDRLRVVPNDADFNPRKSSESLNSTATNSSMRHRLARRTGEIMNKANKAVSLQRFARRGPRDGRSDTSGGRSPLPLSDQSLPSPFAAPVERVSSRQSRSSRSQSNFSDTSESLGTDQKHSATRGWVTNLLSERSRMSNDGFQVVESRGKILDKRSLLSRKGLRISRAHGDPSAQQAPTVGNKGDAANKSRSSLLSTLSGPGLRGQGSSANASGPRGGLDRALRYFMDSGEPEEGLGEGIWLLGVWHAPRETLPLVSAATTDVAPSREREALDQDRPREGGQDDHPGDSQSSPVHRQGSQATRQSPVLDATTASNDSIVVALSSGSGTAANGTQSSADDTVITQISAIANNGSLQSIEQTVSTSVQNSTPGRTASDQADTFEKDFASRIWCTYRSQFPAIARDGSISLQAEQAARNIAFTELEDPDLANDDIQRNGESRGTSRPMAPRPTSPNAGLHTNMSAQLSLGERMGIPNLWNRATAAAQAYGLTGRSGLTTDAGWGCMLRTGQSLLANALLSIHLGREWRRGPKPSPGSQSNAGTSDPDYATRHRYVQYVRILSWFMDEPSLACPFGVHRMAREGKRLGKEVGEWFGPSTAAGAIQRLIETFPDCGLGVNIASDGVIYADQVKAEASRSSSPTARQEAEGSSWKRPVLVLIGVRLGLDGVHHMYHDSIKATFAFPQSVGIAGGRPSSSYYFVGYQGNSLFYLDPHHVRPAVPFRHPPPDRFDDDDWWLEAYSEQELATFHNERPRRMPMKSLDPSMLLGFLIRDQDSLEDFIERVRSLPRPIFSILDSMPRWMMGGEGADEDEEAAIESMTESSGDELGEASIDHSDMAGGSTDLAAAQVPRPVQLDRRSTTASTATVQSDTAYEFVDGEAAAQRPDHAAGPSLQPIKFPTGASTSTLATQAPRGEADGEIVDAPTPEPPQQVDRSSDVMVEEEASDERPFGHHARLGTRSSNFSVVSKSEAGSNWEELPQPKASANACADVELPASPALQAGQNSNDDRLTESSIVQSELQLQQ